MNKELSENEALFKIIRLFIAQYLANVRTYILIKTTTRPFRTKRSTFYPLMFSEVCLALVYNLVMKNLIAEIKRILIMQGRT